MRVVYALTVTVGALALIGWMIAHGAATAAGRPDRDPEERFGVRGRRVVAALAGFGLAGMSAEFASIDIPSPGVLALAVAGAVAAALWAGFAGDGGGDDARDDTDEAEQDR